jgi:hypothetical protein
MSIYTITLESQGSVRINQPGGSVLCFANCGWLAEAHANLLGETAALRKQIEAVRRAVHETTPADKVRESVLKALNEDVPF